MRFFLLISLLGAFLLGVTVQSGLHGELKTTLSTPHFLRQYQQEIKNHFTRPENANLLFCFLTGNKQGVSPFTLKAFEVTNLSFLFSPSGIHLGIIFLFISFFIKRIQSRKVRTVLNLIILNACFFLPQCYSIKRVVILRLFFEFKRLLKAKLSLEKIFFLTFLLSFSFGHYFASPISFALSFIFLGTFFSLKDYPKIILILGLFSTQLIIALFMGNKVSLLAIPVGLLGTFLFSLLFICIIVFFLSFWIIKINWIEPLLNTFVWSVKASSNLLIGSFTSSSIFLILAIGSLMHLNFSRKKMMLISVLLFLHTNTAMTPSIIHR